MVGFDIFIFMFYINIKMHIKKLVPARRHVHHD